MYSYDPANTSFTEEIAPISGVSENWQYSTDGAVRSQPIVLFGGIVVGTASGTVLRIGGSGQAISWEVNLSGAVHTTPAAAGEVIVAVSDGGSIVGIGPEERTTIWETPLGHDGETPTLRSSPTARGGMVYVGTGAGTLHAITATIGEERWREAFESSVETTPAVGSDLVVVGDDEGIVHARDPAMGPNVGRFRRVGRSVEPPRSSVTKCSTEVPMVASTHSRRLTEPSSGASTLMGRSEPHPRLVSRFTSGTKAGR